MKRISKELLAKLTAPTGPRIDHDAIMAESRRSGPRIDHDAIMAESRRSGVPDDELRRVAMDEWYEAQEWERKEERLRVAIAREAVVQARHFGGKAELLKKALLRCFLGSGEIRFSSKLREAKFNQIVTKIDKEIR